MPKEQIKPLEASIMEEWKEKRVVVNKIEKTIIDRIEYIIAKAASICNISRNSFTWYFYGAEEGGMGSLSENITKDDVSYCVEFDRDKSWNDMEIAVGKGSYAMTDGFPTRWLFEDFEDEMKAGRKKFLEDKVKKQEEAKAKKAASVEKKKKVAEEAKKKLSKEELKALGIK
jgi:hypothetical protein